MPFLEVRKDHLILKSWHILEIRKGFNIYYKKINQKILTKIRKALFFYKLEKVSIIYS